MSKRIGYDHMGNRADEWEDPDLRYLASVRQREDARADLFAWALVLCGLAVAGAVVLVVGALL